MTEGQKRTVPMSRRCAPSFSTWIMVRNDKSELAKLGALCAQVNRAEASWVGMATTGDRLSSNNANTYEERPHLEISKTLEPPKKGVNRMLIDVEIHCANLEDSGRVWLLATPSIAVHSGLSFFHYQLSPDDFSVRIWASLYQMVPGDF